jgi:hypothetical protein
MASVGAAALALLLIAVLNLNPLSQQYKQHMHGYTCAQI